MNRNGLYFLAGALVVGVLVVGYFVVQEEQEPALQIEVDDSGLSVETN